MNRILIYVVVVVVAVLLVSPSAFCAKATCPRLDLKITLEPGEMPGLASAIALFGDDQGSWGKTILLRSKGTLYSHLKLTAKGSGEISVVGNFFADGSMKRLQVEGYSTDPVETVEKLETYLRGQPGQCISSRSGELKICAYGKGNSSNPLIDMYWSGDSCQI